MALLLLILVPLAALVIWAVVSDLRRRRRRSAVSSHDISPAARMARANADARGASGLGGSDGPGVGKFGGGAGL